MFQPYCLNTSKVEAAERKRQDQAKPIQMDRAVTIGSVPRYTCERQPGDVILCTDRSRTKWANERDSQDVDEAFLL